MIETAPDDECRKHISLSGRHGVGAAGPRANHEERGRRGRRCLPLSSEVADDAQPDDQRANYIAKALPNGWQRKFSTPSGQSVAIVKMLILFKFYSPWMHCILQGALANRVKMYLPLAVLMRVAHCMLSRKFGA
ncbi:hypothetical protein JM93_03756 [Roseibium hamelinense]|uniref:Uncharacterized protein n=1 Tax=Roseibium hamelinense TaxID=150831 RepID=A0A562SKL4_9HYPH|nr:hypothetical protein [Roseibium hamelinense]TWI81795.1 hypothetical protein JM93_03756 [Roseibium hamelinense]